MENGKKKKLMILTIIIAILIILGVIYIIINKNDKEKNSNKIYNSDINIQKYVNIENIENDLTIYNVDLYNAVKELGKIDNLLNIGDYNISLEYKIKTYNIRLNLTNGPYDDVIAFNLYVNNTLINSDGYNHEWGKYLKIYTLGDYLINECHFHTDVAGTVDIINNDNGNIKVNSIHELDQNKGMIFENINVSSSGITVNGTRAYHGVINYDIAYNICNTTDNPEKLPDDTIVEATYTYKYENGIISLTPEISDRVTLKEYMNKQDNNLCS